MATDEGATRDTGDDPGADPRNDASASGLEIDTSRLVTAYREMGISLRRYLLVYVIPPLLFALATLAVLVVTDISMIVTAPLVALGLFAFVSSLTYPKIQRDQQRKEVRNNFHLFLTHLTVLSLSNIDRVEIFRRLANVEEYKEVADEMRRVIVLVDVWNQSLEDACRIRSKRVASPLMADFLERLSYILGAGQDIGEFLLDEQDSFMQEYVFRYEADLDRLGMLNELYISVVMSSTFLVIFATLIPMVIDVPPWAVIGSVVGLFVVLQIGFVYLVHTISPEDPVWYIEHTAGTTHLRRMAVLLTVCVGITLVGVAFVVAVLLGRGPVAADLLPTPIWVALPFTVLAVPGFVMRAGEQRVKERDDEFPAFIRALGSVESVKQTSTSSVLESLRKKDFGALGENVEGLYGRLQMWIDPTLSWKLFAAETGSHLIHKFGEMYVVGRRMGGEPRELGRLISENMNEVMAVREQRDQAALTQIGLQYGMAATTTFAFFVAVEILGILNRITEPDMLAGETSFVFSPPAYDVQQVTLLLLGLLTINSLLSALIIRLSDRGHPISGLIHFVGILWVSMLTAVFTMAAASAVVGG